MTKISPYLNFDGNARQAFEFYKSVFGGEFLDLNIMSEAPGTEQLPDEEKNRIMHISLPIGSNTILMASDILPSAGYKLTVGNNVHLSLHPETREEADRLFNGLSAGGTVVMPMADQFWGAYFGHLTDAFGVSWMINCDTSAETK